MNKSIIQYLAVGWIGTMGLVSLSQAVPAGDPGPTPQITVYVYNWAQVEPNTLREAKEVATGIFRNAGVEAVLRDQPLASENGPMEAVDQPIEHPMFFVHIFTPAMAKPLGLRTTVLGLAPGTPEERDRYMVYVFDQVAARMAQEHTVAWRSNLVSFSADKGQILGHGIAHEIGHVLLHLALHSPKGLMRANWDRNDLQNVATGDLLFTSAEAERVRAEVTRRRIGNRE
jgi:hypothetical protein